MKATFASIRLRTRCFFDVIRVLAYLSAITLFTSAYATPQADQNQSIVSESALQAQVDDLGRELLRLHIATDDAAKRQIMQDYWAMLQRQMRYLRGTLGVDNHDCKDWVLLDPGATGRLEPELGNACPLMSHDIGPVAQWVIPDKITPALFELMMQQQLEVLRTQTDGISSETDPTKRLMLIRILYETRYQHIQMVRGREWMWTSRDVAALPEAHSLGAEYLQRYCSQCHAAPLPTQYTRGEWQSITSYMHDLIQTQAVTRTSGIQTPSLDELELMTGYLESHAAQ